MHFFMSQQLKFYFLNINNQVINLNTKKTIPAIQETQVIYWIIL